MGRRTWIKIYCDRWLRGTLRDDPPWIRGIWIDLLALAGDSPFSDRGVIQVSAQIGFTDEQIASILKVSASEWLEAKQRLMEVDRISVDGSNAITITNWKVYQSEYERQKPYRKTGPEEDPDKYTKGKYGHLVQH